MYNLYVITEPARRDWKEWRFNETGIYLQESVNEGEFG